jgi:hypothetical protein
MRKESSDEGVDGKGGTVESVCMRGATVAPPLRVESLTHLLKTAKTGQPHEG